MLVLFDLDGTLVSTRGAGLEAVLEAAAALTGRSIRCENTRVDGNLDPVIWSGLCGENGVGNPAELEARFRAEYALRLEHKLREQGRARRMVGTLELVDALAARAEVTVGLLTGNYPETANAKLLAAGFEPARFELGAFGCDAPTRPELVPVARARYAELGRAALESRQIVVIGDTPFDVECARANGVRSLAVATGRYSLGDLRERGADLALSDLRDTHAILDWLLEEWPA